MLVGVTMLFMHLATSRKCNLLVSCFNSLPKFRFSNITSDKSSPYHAFFKDYPNCTINRPQQAPVIISFQIGNNNLSTKIDEFVNFLSRYEGVSS